MPSGHKLTEQQAKRILQLAGEKTADGHRLLSNKAIADRLGVHRHTVENILRDHSELRGTHPHHWGRSASS